MTLDECEHAMERYWCNMELLLGDDSSDEEHEQNDSLSDQEDE